MLAQLYNSNLFGYQTYLEIKGSVVLIHLSVNWLAKAQRIIATKKIYVIANKQTTLYYYYYLWPVSWIYNIDLEKHAD